MNNFVLIQTLSGSRTVSYSNTDTHTYKKNICGDELKLLFVSLSSQVIGNMTREFPTKAETLQLFCHIRICS